MVLERMTKPLTVSRGPIVASQIDIQKADAINAFACSSGWDSAGKARRSYPTLCYRTL